MHPSALLVFVGLFGLLSLPASASAGSEFGGKRWQEPALVFELANTSFLIERDDVALALAAAVAAWNGVGAGPQISVADTDVVHPVELDGVNRVGMWANGSWPYREDAGAATLVYAAGEDDTIAEVDIALNPAFEWTLDPLDDPLKHDLANILTHELGHALGLPDLQQSPAATMYFLVLGGETLKRDLSEEDIALLVELYAGVDLREPSTGCTQAGPFAPAIVLALLALFPRAGRWRRVSRTLDC